MSVHLKCAYNMPHGAVVFCDANIVNDFDIRKVVEAYRCRLQEGVLGQDAAIWELEIHPTNFCNLRCSGCSYANRHDSRTIDIDKLVALMRYYGQFDLRSIFVSGGGDPAFWKGWDALVEHLPDPFPKLGISTNLSSFRRMASAFDRISMFQVHVVGFDKTSTVKEVGVDCFDAVRRNLDQLFSARAVSQQVTMKILVRDDNYLDLPMYLDFISGYPCEAVVIKMCQNFQKNATSLQPGTVESIRHLTLSHAINEKFDFVLDGLADELYRLDSLPPGTCSFANSGLYRLVTAGGAAFPCVASTRNGRYSCGQLTGDPRRPLAQAVEPIESRIDPSICPRQACRHYRCSLVIDDSAQASGFPCEDPHGRSHPRPVLL